MRFGISVRLGFPKLGGPYWGPHYKGVLLFGDYILEVPSFISPLLFFRATQVCTVHPLPGKGPSDHLGHKHVPDVRPMDVVHQAPWIPDSTQSLTCKNLGIRVWRRLLLQL